MTRSEKIYTSLCVIFSILIVVNNLIYQKFVTLPILPFHTFELSIGAILYPLTFLLSDLIAEFYGKEQATFCVRFAMAMNIMVAIIIWGMDHLQATSWSKISNDEFHKMFGAYSVAFTGSVLACYIAQLVDIRIYLWIKKLTNDKWLWLRNNGSTAISLFVDTSIVVGFMCFFNILPVERMIPLILNSYSFKLFFTLCNTPLFYVYVWVIRKLINPNVFRR